MRLRFEPFEEKLMAKAEPVIRDLTEAVAETLPGEVFEQPDKNMGGDYGWAVEQHGDRPAGTVWTVSNKAKRAEATDNNMVKGLPRG